MPTSIAPAGAIFGRYQLLGALGRGRTATVYEALDHTGTRVAVKVLRSAAALPGETEVELARFRREALAAARVRHPHIVEILDVGEVADAPFLAMEMMRGGSLAQLLSREAKLPPRQAVDILLPIIAALHEVHMAGVLHRDVKPSNVLLTADGQPKLADFGLSRVADDVGSITQSQETLGTPAYMAPETVLFTATASTELSDQYGLGVTLYECICGQPPFAGDSAYEVMHAVVSTEPRPLSDREPGVPGDLGELVSRTMRRDPQARFGSLKELGAALLPFASRRVASRWGTFASTKAGEITSTTPGSGIELDENTGHASTTPLASTTGSMELAAPLVAFSDSLRINATDSWDELASRIARAPEEATIRGMFFSELLRRAPEALTSPPRYLPFGLYPVRHYMQLLLRVAPLVHPSEAPARALLGLGLDVYPLFASSIAGTALFAFAGFRFDRICELSSKAYAITLRPGATRVVRCTGDEAVVQLRDVWPFPDVFHAGIWIGAMHACGVRGSIEVTRVSLCGVDFHMRWSNAEGARERYAPREPHTFL